MDEMEVTFPISRKLLKKATDFDYINCKFEFKKYYTTSQKMNVTSTFIL